jgi:hypothetical protein
LSKATLVWLRSAVALHSTRSFASVLTSTFRLLQELNRPPTAPRRQPQKRRRTRTAKQRASRHPPRPGGRTCVTEEAFVQARKRMQLMFWTTLIGLLSKRCQQEHPQRVRWKRFRLLARDGSSVNLPHGADLADRFGTAKSGQSPGHRQARMVMLQLLVRWLILDAAVEHGIREGRRIEPLCLSFKHALE